MDRLGLGFVDFLKIDAEGWDRDVIKGADLPRNAARFGAVYFECGSHWFDSRRGKETASIEEVMAAFAAVGFECFLGGVSDLARITAPPAWSAPLKESISGYGPNVLCLNAAYPAVANALLAAHKLKLDQCTI